MANKSLFAAVVGKLIPATNARNHEGAPAYELTPKAALAQLAVTGTFNGTFYADARTQLADVLALATEVETEYLAKVAVYASESGYMKDMPATLLALLSTLPGDAFSRAFPRIVKNGKMLRTFVQVMRSGTIGRKSLGSRPKRLVEAWLDTASDIEIMRASIGNDPSLADVIKMVHPKPATEARRALYAYLIGKPYDVAALPAVATEFEAFKRDPSGPVPNVPFQMLTSLDLSPLQHMEIARKSGWQMLRQNLNTFERGRASSRMTGSRRGCRPSCGMRMRSARRASSPTRSWRPSRRWPKRCRRRSGKRCRMRWKSRCATCRPSRDAWWSARMFRGRCRRP